MAILASVKNFLERNAEQLRQERGFWSQVGYVINQNLAKITPDTSYGSTSDHFALAAGSLGEQVKAAGRGIKHALWDEAGRFAIEAVARSGAENSLYEPVLGGLCVGLYYAKAFTYDAVVGVGKALIHGGKALANGGTMEEILLAESEIFGGVGAAAGMGLGFAAVPQIASKLGNTTYAALQTASGEMFALVESVPTATSTAVAAAMPGAIGITLMAAGGSGGSGKGAKPRKGEHTKRQQAPAATWDKGEITEIRGRDASIWKKWPGKPLDLGEPRVSAAIDQLQTLQRRTAGRVFHLTWEGIKTPHGVRILGREIECQHKTVYSGGKIIGTYERLTEFGGPSGQMQEMILYLF